MFRRGPLRRAARIMTHRPLATLADRPRQLLREANLHMERGNYSRAAEMFENLGRGAEARAIHQRVPFLYLQAARAYLYAGQITLSIPLLRQALKLLADAHRWDAFNRNASLAIEELQHKGYIQQADQLQGWIEQVKQNHPEAASRPVRITQGDTPRPHLPAKCPFCGASLRPDEVEWLDDTTAECPYCGSSVFE